MFTNLLPLLLFFLFLAVVGLMTLLAAARVQYRTLSWCCVDRFEEVGLFSNLMRIDDEYITGTSFCFVLFGFITTGLLFLMRFSDVIQTSYHLLSLPLYLTIGLFLLFSPLFDLERTSSVLEKILRRCFVCALISLPLATYILFSVYLQDDAVTMNEVWIPIYIACGICVLLTMIGVYFNQDNRCMTSCSAFLATMYFGLLAATGVLISLAYDGDDSSLIPYMLIPLYVFIFPCCLLSGVLSVDLYQSDEHSLTAFSRDLGTSVDALVEEFQDTTDYHELRRKIERDLGFIHDFRASYIDPSQNRFVFN